MEGDELDNLTKSREIEYRVSHGLGVLADLVEAGGVEEGVARGGFEEEVERHRPTERGFDEEKIGFLGFLLSLASGFHLGFWRREGCEVGERSGKVGF